MTLLLDFLSLLFFGMFLGSGVSKCVIMALICRVFSVLIRVLIHE